MRIEVERVNSIIEDTINSFLQQKKERIEEKIKNSKEQNLTLLSQAVNCYVKVNNPLAQENSGSFVIIGNLIDAILKDKIGSKHEPIIKKIEGLNIIASPDIVIDNTIYEIKTSYYSTLQLSWVLQTYGYAYFYRKKPRIILINPNAITTYKVKITKDLHNLFMNSVRLYSQQKPNTIHCPTCPLKETCEFSIYKKSEKIREKIGEAKYYIMKHNISDNSYLITPSGGIYQAVYIDKIEKREKEIQIKKLNNNNGRNGNKNEESNNGEVK